MPEADEPREPSEAVDAAAIGAADEADVRNTRIDKVTLENGIVLKIKPVPLMAVGDASRRLPEPEIPEVWIETRERTEPNPSDPTYLRQLTQWTLDREVVGLRVAFILGSEMLSVPDGVFGPDDDEWIEQTEAAMELAGVPLEIPREGAARYLAWLENYAIISDVDQFRLTRVLLHGLGLTEEDVATAVAAFQRRSREWTDSLAGITSRDQD